MRMKSNTRGHLFIYAMIFFLISIDLPVLAGNRDVEANLFGSDHHPKNELGIPATGDIKLLRELRSVVLEGIGKSSMGVGLKITDAQLVDLVPFIQNRIKFKKEWEIRLAEGAGEMRVSGTLDNNLLEGLISLMQNGKFYCRITKGVIELRLTPGNKLPINNRKKGQEVSESVDYGPKYGPKPEFIVPREELAKGWVEYFGLPPGPRHLWPNPLPAEKESRGRTISIEKILDVDFPVFILCS